MEIWSKCELVVQKFCLMENKVCPG